MVDSIGELNPFSPTVPDSIRALSPDLYDFLRNLTQTARTQHNKTQAGDSTFPWQVMQAVDDSPIHNLGSLGSFYHADYGIVQGRYVQFDNLSALPVGGPVMLNRSSTFSWTVTNDVKQAQTGLVVGLGCTDHWPANKMYGWILVSGVNLLSLAASTSLKSGTIIGLTPDGRIVASAAGTSDFGHLYGDSDSTGLLAPGQVFVSVGDLGLRSVGDLSQAPAITDLESQFITLKKSLTKGLDTLEANYSLSRAVTLDPNQASVALTETLNAIANFKNLSDFAANQAGQAAQLTQITLSAINELTRQSRVYRDQSGFYADSTTVSLNIATAKSNIATYQAVVATGAAAQASESAAQAYQYSLLRASNSTNLIPDVQYWTYYNGASYNPNDSVWGGYAQMPNPPANEAVYARWDMDALPGVTLTLSADLRCIGTDAAGYVFMTIEYFDSNGAHIEYSDNIKLTASKDFTNPDNRQYTVTHVTPANAARLSIYWGGKNVNTIRSDMRRPKLEFGTTATGYSNEGSLIQVNASVLAEQYARIQADSAEAGLRVQLAVQVGQNTADIQTVSQARVDGDKANSDQITTLTANYGQLSATVTQNLSAVADSSGVARARWTITAAGSNGRRSLTLDSDVGVDITGNLRVSGDLTVDGTVRLSKLDRGQMFNYATGGVSGSYDGPYGGTSYVPGLGSDFVVQDGGKFTFTINCQPASVGSGASTDVGVLLLDTSNNPLYYAAANPYASQQGNASTTLVIPNVWGAMTVRWRFYLRSNGSNVFARVFNPSANIYWSFV